MIFSPKQVKTLNWWTETDAEMIDGIICDGAIRSGKTKSMSLGFVLWSMITFQDENFALCGKTIQSLRRNVIKPLKMDIDSMKRPKLTVTEHRSENYLTISDGSVSNDYYIFGGKDESSQDLIQGMTLAGVFLDEVALMPESFVNQATGRCSVTGSKMWFNCNPEGPDHYFKEKWIDQADEKRLLHLHFTMDDNPSLSDQVRDRYKRMYSGVFYDRFILGEWVLASGIIFKYFAQDPEPYLIDRADTERQVWSHLVMGIDFGGNGSMTTMCLTGYQNNYRNLIVLEEDGLPVTEDIDAKMICDKFVKFYRMCLDKYGRVDWIFPDSASTTMINSIITAARKAGLPTRGISGCRKNEIAERPKTVDLLFNTGRLKIVRDCQSVIKALSSLRWDEKKKNIPEDKNIGNCNDWYDAFCYTWIDFVEFVDLAR